MMVDVGGSTLCSNCKKDVATSNYPIHEIHCKRFIQLCPLCDEPVPTAELQEHREREHRQVKCCQCDKGIEKCQLERHEIEECVERMVSCRFCDLATPCRTLPEHEETCGSRTGRCPDCGKYVMHRDQESHEQVCPSVQSAGQVSVSSAGETVQIPCEFCTEMFPEDQLLHHQDGCRSLSGLMERFRDSLWRDPPSYPDTPSPVGALPPSSEWRSTFDESEDLDEIGFCRVCDCALPQGLLQRHEMKCRFFDQHRKNRMQQNPINKSNLL
ncbi:XIAP-associated factor 1 [Scyliorhinus torazame]|uniref:XIAP-associated factor 1 n=1 Tax=Scyliorhinus torazame TaxID=75743 RepID=UPI003B5CE4A9